MALIDKEEEIILCQRLRMISVNMGGYFVGQVEGQRKFGPPIWWSGDPPKDTEVYVTSLPRDMYEDELIPIMERAGAIYQIRLMMEFSGRTRGTAYVSFCGQESVAKALQMDYMELRNGHKLRIHKSFDNKCLYIGKLPPNCSKINLGAALESITNQRIYDLYIHRVKKAGCKDYALIRYPTHCDAILARKVLQKLQIFINNQPINVDWADYDPLDFDGNLVENAKSLFFRNLDDKVTETFLEQVINNIIKPDIVQVKKLKNYAFAHFQTHQSAKTVLTTLKYAHIFDQEIEVMWSRPVCPRRGKIRRQEKKKKENCTKNRFLPKDTTLSLLFENEDFKVECPSVNVMLHTLSSHPPHIYHAFDGRMYVQYQ